MSKQASRKHRKPDHTKRLLVAVICVLLAVIAALVTVYTVLPAIRAKAALRDAASRTAEREEVPAAAQEADPGVVQGADPGVVQEERGVWFDPAATAGELPGKTQEEIQQDRDKVIADGMFNISIASVIVFEDAHSRGQARIENIAANPYHMSVGITLDGTNETVYASGLIEPGSYIEYITLDPAPPPGEYPATAAFTVYDLDTLDPAGYATARITIVVDS